MKMRVAISGVFVLVAVVAFVTRQNQLTVPANFPRPVYNLSANPVTEQGFELGRSLFYDPILSVDGTISCGSCHQQWAGFTNQDHTGSHGVRNQLGIRNALPLFNLAFYENFFWDGGVHDLDFTPLNAIESPIEMDESLENVLKKLNESEEYRGRFRQVFQVEEITSREFLKALSQFLASMVSAGSRYDKYIRKEEGVELSASELAGLKLLEQKCTPCHAAPLFTDYSFKDNGVPNSFRFDKGREEITLTDTDRGKYRVPSLRNLGYTAPYMHDGSIRTLEEVLDHYTSGMEDHENLDPLFRMRPGMPGLELTEEEKKNILHFLETLNDESFIKDRRFSEQ